MLDYLNQSFQTTHTHSIPYLPTQLDAVVLTTHCQSHRTEKAHSVSGENELKEGKERKMKKELIYKRAMI